jgi:hypothetical protein
VTLPRPDPTQKKTNSTVFQLQAALAQPGCAVCTIIDAAGTRWVESLLYEYVNDVPIRDALSRNGGFCRHHAEICQRFPSGAFGTSVIYRSLLGDFVRRLDTDLSRCGVPRQSLLRRIRRHPSSPEFTCVACRTEHDIETDVIDALVHGFADPKLRSVFDDSGGLCRTHLERAQRVCQDPDLWQQLVQSQRKAVTRVLNEIDEFIGKHDYHRNLETITPEEGHARATAIGLLAPRCCFW